MASPGPVTRSRARPSAGNGSSVGNGANGNGDAAVDLKTIAVSELRRHDRPHDCWLAIHGKVYDVTRWVPNHPGGDLIWVHAGFDCSHLFDSYHPLRVQALLGQYCIGRLAPPAAAQAPAADVADAPEVRYTPTEELKPGGFYFVLKQRVEAYFKSTGHDPRGGLHMLLKAAVILVAFGACFYLALFDGRVTLGAAVCLAATAGFLKAQVGMSIQHDANHGALGKGLLARALGASLDAVGASSFMWRQQHVVGHHAYTNVHGTGVHGGDPDIRSAVRRSTPAQPWARHHAVQHVYLAALYGLLSLKSCSVDDFESLATGAIGTVRLARMTAAEAGVFWGGKALFWGYYVALPLAAGARPAGQTLLLLLLAEAVTGWTLALFFSVAHLVGDVQYPVPDAKTGVLAGGWAAAQMRTTADFAPGSVLWSTLSGGLSHQVVHHLFPAVCHVHYTALYPIVRDTAAEFGLPYNAYPTFWLALGEHFKHLRKMGAGRAGVPSLNTIG